MNTARYKKVIVMKNAFEFLLYSYFGITSDSKIDEILTASIKRAYQDASSHVLSVKEDKDDFNATLKKYNESEKEYKQNGKLNEVLRNIGTQFLHEEIKFLIESKDDIDYNDFHVHLCNRLIELYKADDKECEYYKKDKHGNLRKFTYGIAQKWVNMTMKYLYLLHDLFDCDTIRNDSFIKIDKFICNYKEDFHVPIDSYIIDAVWENKDIDVIVPGCNKDKHYINGKKKEFKNRPSEHFTRWSKLNDTDYVNFQKSLCDKLKDKNIIPIEWEGPTWLQVAKSITK